MSDNEQPENKRQNNGDEDRDGQGRFLPGNPGGGRPQGAKGRTSRQVVEGILLAFEERGGVAYLNSLDDERFVRLLARILPRQVELDATIAAESRLPIIFQETRHYDVAGEKLADLPDAALAELAELVRAELLRRRGPAAIEAGKADSLPADESQQAGGAKH